MPENCKYCVVRHSALGAQVVMKAWKGGNPGKI